MGKTKRATLATYTLAGLVIGLMAGQIAWIIWPVS